MKYIRGKKLADKKVVTFLVVSLVGLFLFAASVKKSNFEKAKELATKEKVILLRKDKSYPPIHIDPR